LAVDPAVQAGTGLELNATSKGWCGRFSAMASTCEVLIEGVDEAQALHLAAQAREEALRIERKFSRYRSDSVIAAIHAAQGRPLQLDDETSLLIDFAARCHGLSDGLFDVTTGVLRAAWRFDGGGHLPEPAQLRALCQRVGFQHLIWQRPWLTLPVGMEIDLGGIGKEYAVDRVLGLLKAQSPAALLVNFGGDLAVSGPRASGGAWQVGIERPDEPVAAGLIELSAGALATSGDAHRYLLHEGVRYGHILDPRTGWPVRGAPRSVTVAAGTCTEAGLLATLALLQGAQAVAWLKALDHPHWVLH
jgi:thiamine biosynthesis lipoprotein